MIKVTKDLAELLDGGFTAVAFIKNDPILGSIRHPQSDDDGESWVSWFEGFYTRKAV